MTKRSPIFKFLLVAGIAANVVVLGMIASGSKEPAAAREGDLERYTSEIGGYSVVYPASWRRVPSGDSRIAQEMTFHCSRNSRITVFAVGRISLMADLYRRETGPFLTRELPDVHRDFLRVLDQVIVNLRTTPAANMQVSGQNALVTTYEGERDRSASKKPVKGIVVSAWNSDYYISFRLSAPPQEFDEMQKAFGDFLQEVRLGLPMKGLD